ncbi:MAG: hypothetical protein HYU52_17860 [Acidobacteria bacterium]|nr:hypothetical protein [Acidobacteriota bacterium]
MTAASAGSLPRSGGEFAPNAYRYFDFTISSSFPIPELPAAPETTPALAIAMSPAIERGDRFEPVLEWRNSEGDIASKLFAFERRLVLDFPGLGAFEVSAGSGAVRCITGGTNPSEAVRHLLLTSVLPLLTAGRGNLVLHASCVAIDAAAVLFVGHSGAGKSTLAAGLAHEGYEFISDDCVLVTPSRDGALCVAPFDELRLWPDSAAALLNDASCTGPVPGAPGKLRTNAHGPVHRATANSVPLRAIYVVEPMPSSSSPAIVPLSPAEAFEALLSNQFRLDPRDEGCARAHFDALAELTASCATSRLQVPRSLSALPYVCREIVADTRDRVE